MLSHYKTIIVSFMLFYLLSPPGDPFTFWGFLKLFLVDFTLAIPYRLTFLFFARMIIDFVPNEIRNSVYSLLPTLTLIINIPAALLGGELLENIGIPYTILVIVGGCAIGVILQAIGLKSRKKTSSIDKI